MQDDFSSALPILPPHQDSNPRQFFSCELSIDLRVASEDKRNPVQSALIVNFSGVNKRQTLTEGTFDGTMAVPLTLPA